MPITKVHPFDSHCPFLHSIHLPESGLMKWGTGVKQIQCNGRTGTDSVTMFLYFKEAGWSIKLAIRSTLNIYL